MCGEPESEEAGRPPTARACFTACLPPSVPPSLTSHPHLGPPSLSGPGQHSWVPLGYLPAGGGNITHGHSEICSMCSLHFLKLNDQKEGEAAEKFVSEVMEYRCGCYQMQKKVAEHVCLHLEV